MLATSGILYAFEHCELAGKAVLLLLLLGSIFSWSVIWSKWVQLNAVLKSTRAFLPIFRSATEPLEPYLSGRPPGDSPQAVIYHAGAKELCFHLTGSSVVDSTLAARLASARRSGLGRGVAASAVPRPAAAPPAAVVVVAAAGACARTHLKPP